MNQNIKENIRIILVNQFFPPDYAPTGQLLNDLTKRISSKKINILVLTGYPKYAFKKKKIITKDEKFRKISRTKINQIWPLSFGSKFMGGLLFTLRSVIYLIFKLRKNDLVIYTSEPPFLVIFGWLLSLIIDHKYVVIAYDLYPDVLTSLGFFSNKNPIITIWKILNKYSYSKAKNIIVLSSLMEKKLNSNIKKINSKIRVIPSWVDPDFIRPINKDENWFIKKNNLNSKFVVLYSGNQGRCHDLFTIVKTAKIMSNEENIIFLFIGDGAQNKSLKNYVKINKLKNCKFLPYQSYKNIPFSLTSADLALITLNKNASEIVAPSKLYGHLAAGSPIATICPRSSYLAELVSDKGFGKHFLNGDYIGLAEWILELKNSQSLTNSFEKKAREYIKLNASPEVVIKKYLQVISESIN